MQRRGADRGAPAPQFTDVVVVILLAVEQIVATDHGGFRGEARLGADRGGPMPQIMKVFVEFWDWLLTCLLLRIVRELSAENCGGSAIVVRNAGPVLGQGC